MVGGTQTLFLAVGVLLLTLDPARAAASNDFWKITHAYYKATIAPTSAGVPEGTAIVYARTYDGWLGSKTGYAMLVTPNAAGGGAFAKTCKDNTLDQTTSTTDECKAYVSYADACCVSTDCTSTADSAVDGGSLTLQKLGFNNHIFNPSFSNKATAWEKDGKMSQFVNAPRYYDGDKALKTFVMIHGSTTAVPANQKCALLTPYTDISLSEIAELHAVYNKGAYPPDEPVDMTPCKPFDMNKAFPPWAADNAVGFQLGFPIAKGDVDDLLCPKEWWHVRDFQLVRYIFWIMLFVLTIVLFFAFSCFIMPRLNGRKDTTGICGKWGNVISDKLDKNPKMVAMKRKRDDNWNGMLFIVFKHFNKSESGHLSPDEFYQMFDTVGDGFVDKNLFAVAASTFGNSAEGSNEALLDIEALEAMYSAGNQSWRAKHSQCKRDLERVKILSDNYPDYLHSDYLVITGSIGSAGMSQYEMKKIEMGGDDVSPKQKAAAAKKQQEYAAKMRRASSTARAGSVELAAKGGVAFAKSADHEFDIEIAMSEEERFSVPLPSLYIETWLFTLICAFIFLFLFDLTRYIDNVTMENFRLVHCSCADCANNFVNAKERIKCLDSLPPGFTAWFRGSEPHPSYFYLWINGKITVISDIGHKVCIFHFLFILFFVMPMRLFSVLKPESCCARQMRERLQPQPLVEREYRPLKKNEKLTINVIVSEENAPGKEIDVKHGDRELGQSFKHTIPATARMGATLEVEIPQGPDFQGIPVDCLISATALTPCDKIQLLPLILLRNFMSFFVALFNLIGVSLSLFIFFDPLITFKENSLILAHVRVSGCSFAFAADPNDAYMRWLNVEIINMLLCGCYKKRCKRKAEKMYLGFLDSQIRWNVASTKIPKGLDLTRKTEFFQAAVAPLEYFVQFLFQLPMWMLTPIWPAWFAKHISVGRKKLWLSKLRFGGRQPRLGGSFAGSSNGTFNREGCARVSMINGITCCSHITLGPCQKKFDVLLEENIEWVVPPPSGRCCAYAVCPFPCDGSDEDLLSIDEPIPVIIDAGDLGFKLNVASDTNALTAEEVAIVLNSWAKHDKTGQRMNAIDANAATVTPEIAKGIIKKLTLNDGVAKSTLNARELKSAVDAYLLLATDVRCSSPIFKRTRKSTVSSLYAGFEQQIKARGIGQSNPMGGAGPSKSKISIGMNEEGEEEEDGHEVSQIRAAAAAADEAATTSAASAPTGATKADGVAKGEREAHAEATAAAAAAAALAEAKASSVSPFSPPPLPRTPDASASNAPSPSALISISVGGVNWTSSSSSPPSQAAPAPQTEDTLPRGWSKSVHEGAPYYTNVHTGETTFTEPTLPAAPEGWSVYEHGDDGEHYFQHDAADGATQWHHPHDEDPEQQHQ